MTQVRAPAPSRAAAAAFALAAIAYPLIFTGRFEIGAAIAVGAMAIGAIGFVLLIGYAHQLALGQAAFCLIGGYGSALLTTRYGVDPLLAMVASMIVSALLAWAIGRPILKLRGFSLAMASLALQLILVFLAIEMPSFTGGAEGVPGVPKFALLGWKFESDIAYFYLVWVLVGLSLAFGLNVVTSRIGRALKAIGATETAAASVGIDITHYKVQMFVASAAMASVTGSLTVHYLRIMEPHIFGFVFSLNIITAVIVGGLHSIWGGMLGAAVLVALREALRALRLPTWEVVIMGALTVLVLMLFRQGLAGALAAAYRRLLPPAPEAPAHAEHRAQRAREARRVRELAGSGRLEITGVSKSFGNLRAVPQVAEEARDLRAHAGEWLEFVGSAQVADQQPGTLPLGHQRLVEIPRALASAPLLLLMDEPASGLNDSETEALARLILRIRALGITVLLVEHDVRLVMGLTEHIVVMSHGEKIAEGPPAMVRASPQVISAYLGTA